MTVDPDVDRLADLAAVGAPLLTEEQVTALRRVFRPTDTTLPPIFRAPDLTAAVASHKEAA